MPGKAVDELPALLPAVALVVDGKPGVLESLEVSHHRAAAAAEESLLETVNPLASLERLGIPVGLGNDNLPIGPLDS
ncbi:MAG: hypothetical protein ACRD21_25405, partial [Vicinamibacteria bacterium]